MDSGNSNYNNHNNNNKSIGNQNYKQKYGPSYTDGTFYLSDSIVELVEIIRYDIERKGLKKEKVLIKIGEKIASGGMRTAYHMTLVESNIKCVLKIQKNKQLSFKELVHDNLSAETAQKYSKLFNDRNPPKRISINIPYIICFIERPGKPIAQSELFLEGIYKKYNTNNGYIGIDRNTPQAFSHFTYEASNKTELVVDIQGVNDCYTDLQIHTTDSTKYGQGNLGQKGINSFFKSHRCNSICKWLGLNSDQGMQNNKNNQNTQINQQNQQSNQYNKNQFYHINQIYQQNYLSKSSNSFLNHMNLNTLNHSNNNLSKSLDCNNHKINYSNNNNPQTNNINYHFSNPGIVGDCYNYPHYKDQYNHFNQYSSSPPPQPIIYDQTFKYNNSLQHNIIAQNQSNLIHNNMLNRPSYSNRLSPPNKPYSDEKINQLNIINDHIIELFLIQQKQLSQLNSFQPPPPPQIQNQLLNHKHIFQILYKNSSTSYCYSCQNTINGELFACVSCCYVYCESCYSNT